jgi:ribosomal protein S18 acetylase RimI-like enzyme
MTQPPAGHPLDNPVWSALSAADARLADVASVDGARAGRYHTDVCPFGAIEDAADPAGWAALSSLLDGGTTCVFVDPSTVPDGWEVVIAIPGVQMDGSGLEPADDTDAVVLTEADVPDMLDLVKRTQPGPYRRRTIEMGRYLGIRHGGELVAMAGERMHPSGWTELSAVCTDDRYRGQGLGTRLVRAVAAGVRRRWELPFLHASADNVNAIRLYGALGFTLRRTCWFTVVRPPAAG